MPRRGARQPPGTGAVADAARAPAHRPRQRQPLLGAGLRAGARLDRRRLRRHRRAAGEPETARLAGRRVPRVGLGREGALPADGDLRHLPPVRGRPRREKLEKDPDNRLLSRGPRFRMDAEMIRDFALRASGLLSATIGGPSVKPYQPAGRLGGRGDGREQHEDLRARPRRGQLSPQPLHLLEARGPAAVDGDLQRAHAASSAPSTASGRTRRCRPS